MSNSRIREPPRGVLDGIRKDAEANRLERLTGESQRGHGNAWSHGYLNQKPWHPLSYRNQRDLFLAEEAAVKAKADNDAAQAEFDREQEFYRSTQLMSGRERERLTDQQQLGFMYQKPPGYEAMLEKEKEEAVKRQRLENADHGVLGDGEGADAEGARNKGTRDMYGRRVATAEEFECLKGAPKEATAGADAHVKPFGVEIRMVKCLRCGKWGHSGTDRECPLRDQNPNDAFRMRLEDPLTLMKARNDLAKQEKGLQLKYVPGTSPLRGGGDRLADNQRILAPEVSGDEEELRDGENILDRLPKKERKRLIKDYMKKEKEKERAEKRAKLAAAQQFLAAAGVDTTAALAAGGAEESNGGSREKKKSKNSNKSRHKSKKHKRKRRDTDSDSSSSDSD